MPWKSKAQAAWGHSASGVKALGSKGVKEWDKATPKGSLKVKRMGPTMKLSALKRAKSGY